MVANLWRLAGCHLQPIPADELSQSLATYRELSLSAAASLLLRFEPLSVHRAGCR
jgi:hypothetical protein